jgi:hypothetical protein
MRKDMASEQHPGTAHEVAYRLFANIAWAEQKQISAGFGGEKPDRNWILTTYAACLEVAVKGRSGLPS